MTEQLKPTGLEEENIRVELTYDHLDAQSIINRVKSPKAGAVVLFAGSLALALALLISHYIDRTIGCTRDTFDSKPVKHLQYSAYPALALATMMKIAKEMKEKHSLVSIAIIHRLGTVPTGEESILIAVSSPHRQSAWGAGEEALELTKEKVEVWKLEEFEGEEPGVWRANRDGQAGFR
jgi:molybdopterin synthase catalytic subunit